MLKRMSILAVAACSSVAMAQPYSLDWATIDGGGGTSTGGGYKLSGTIGQHDANNPMAGGVYDLVPGYWGGVKVSCAIDLNGDGLVNFADVLLFIDYFGAANPGADLNDDGLINFADVLLFIDLFAAGC